MGHIKTRLPRPPLPQCYTSSLSTLLLNKHCPSNRFHCSQLCFCLCSRLEEEELLPLYPCGDDILWSSVHIKATLPFFPSLLACVTRRSVGSTVLLTTTQNVSASRSQEVRSVTVECVASSCSNGCRSGSVAVDSCASLQM